MKTKAARVGIPGKHDRSPEGKFTNPHGSIIPCLEKLPHEAFTEESALSGISKFEKRAVLRKLRDSVRWGKLRRVCLRGTVWFFPGGEDL